MLQMDVYARWMTDNEVERAELVRSRGAVQVVEGAMKSGKIMPTLHPLSASFAADEQVGQDHAEAGGYWC